MIIVLALALLGVAYGLWSQSLFIRGIINTGNVKASFTRSFTDDDGTVNDPTRDSQDTGNCAISINGDPSCDPAASGADIKAHYDKAVANCRATILPNGTTAQITLNGAYPDYFCTAWLAITNNGSIPVKLASAQVNGQAVNPGVPQPFDLNGDGALDAAIHLTEIKQCQQIDPGETVYMDVDQQVLMGAPQSSALTYIVELQFNQWNEPCTPPAVTLPVYNVTQAGITQAQATSLAENLGIPADMVGFQDGAMTFVDPAKFQAVPMMDASGNNLGLGEDDVPGQTLLQEGFDFNALSDITPIPTEDALNKTQAAFKAALLPAVDGRPMFAHSMFDAVNVDGSMMADGVQLDTQVNYEFELGGIPLIGPGAQVGMTYGPDGNVTQLVHSMYQVEQGAEVPIMGPDQAQDRCKALNAGLGDVQTETSLVYLAPPLEGGGAMYLLPYYQCQGTAQMGDDQVVLLQSLFPAITDPQYVPTVELTAALQGRTVNASAAVNGGTPPYSYQWESSSTDLSGEDGSSVQYVAEASERSSTETVAVTVTDANGVSTTASQSLTVVIGLRSTGPRLARLSALVGGTTDFGVERGVSDLGAANQAGFANRMDDEAFKRFNWSGVNAWERDFIDPNLRGDGLDESYVDNVDLTFYIGHGWPGGFTFEGNHADTSIVYNDSVDWGDLDIEWLSLLSCSVLKGYPSGMPPWYQRWGPDFDRLHLLTGFETTAYDSSGFGYRYADYLLGRKILFINLPPVPVRVAWLAASKEIQPSGVTATVIGVYGPGGITNYNDYFWGQGPVGPDIPRSSVQGYWRVWVTSP